MVARRLFSTQDIEAMGYEGVNALTSELVEVYLEARDEEEWGTEEEADADVASGTPEKAEGAEGGHFVTVEDVAGFAYQVFLVVDEPGVMPFSEDDMTDAERLDYLTLAEQWKNRLRHRIEVQFGGVVDCSIDSNAEPFFEVYDPSHFWRFGQMRKHGISLLWLTGTRVEDAEVAITARPGHDAGDGELSPRHIISVSCRRRDTGSVLGMVELAQVLNEDVEDEVTLVRMAFESLGFEHVIAPVFDEAAR